MTELAADVVLQVEDLRTHFELGRRVAKSVDGVSFSVRRGETVAVVGESGSGKSVTSLSIMRLLAPPGRIIGGRILYRRRDGSMVDIAELPEKAMRAVRGREIAMIFQEPMTSLNPLFTVGDQISEMILLHEPVGRAAARARAKRMLELVEIPAAERRLDDYPHQMSGGMRQRVMIALALACTPSLLIADEPTTALDVTIQAQILDLLRRLQAQIGMSILFVTHNLGVVAEIAHEVVVMYAGRVVEQAPVTRLFERQKHPYTRGLLACIPDASRDRGAAGERLRLNPIPGNVPNVTALPAGCSFAARCPYVVDVCTKDPGPPLVAAEVAHLSRCWRHEAL
ncbi:ABC transporter ATP-binding protein [Chelatococcus sp. SYSU_G07232]|uniref:ABC transporter ATP-binding protein n=1 Tax=Chelatococcus albus TaxID=3047466 RepID=A0ABT7AHH0_9HYPH|nr:ABC transporter ATP-binding protein [Chelatococcus sp. SYSU_G07232]MDJ1158825.1 ABC transporter ATP-binding protein [Chelatococcus sp. SYSU_G07232]